MIERIPQFVWPILLGVLMLIAVPLWLLGDDSEPPTIMPPPVMTELKVAPVPAISVLLTKPLFNADRSPAVALAESGGADPGATAQTVQQAPAPRLVGVISGRRGKAAAIVKAASGLDQTLTRGQLIDGWQLVSVGRNEAVFSIGERRETVSLDYANRGNANSSATASIASPTISPNPAQQPQQ